jgi:peptidoglycan/LPS O-acetylase OafA/YrhL
MTTPPGPALPPDAPAPVAGGSSLSYLPALDGIRAIAVLGVMGYHGGVSWLAGGFFGVDAFFVLSGFLITTLLLTEWQRSGAIRLGAFWARRARRLLPALVLVVLFVAFYASVIVPRGTYPNLRLDALSSLFYVGNWHFILIGSNYFNQTGLPSPLTHTWSLAIEEQFYLVWPLVVLGVMKFTRRLGVLLGICVAGAAASVVEMAVLYGSGADLTRLYYGTDTHAQCVLIGAALAVALALIAQRRAAAPALTGATRPQRTVDQPGWVATTPRARLVLSTSGLAGLAGCAVLWSQLDGNSPLLFQGGFLLASLASLAVLVSALCVPRSPVSALLSLAPLRYLGRISYGMYLWHYPLFIWIDGARTGLDGYPLFLVRCLATVAVATASFYLVERPIRQGTFLREWRAWVATPVAAAVTFGVLGAATAAPATAFNRPGGVVRPSSPLYTGPPVRVLLEGDSVGLTLGFGLSAAGKLYDVVVQNHGLLGCGVVSGRRVQLQGVNDPTAFACDGQGTTPQWDQRWQRDVNSFHPNVVLVSSGRWEVVNRTYQGQWTNILSPTYANYVKRELLHAADVAGSRGARVVLLTAPCFSSGEQPDGQPWPEDEATRLAAYNDLVRQVAAERPAVVSVVDLDALVCPGGHYRATISGVQVRRVDGVHFTLTGGIFLATRVWPIVVPVGRAQMALNQSRG